MSSVLLSLRHTLLLWNTKSVASSEKQNGGDVTSLNEMDQAEMLLSAKNLNAFSRTHSSALVVSLNFIIRILDQPGIDVSSYFNEGVQDTSPQK